MWDYFEKKVIFNEETHKDKEVATCTLCQRETAGSEHTSNQLSHLKIITVMSLTWLRANWSHQGKKGSLNRVTLA